MASRQALLDKSRAANRELRNKLKEAQEMINGFTAGAKLAEKQEEPKQEELKQEVAVEEKPAAEPETKQMVAISSTVTEQLTKDAPKEMPEEKVMVKQEATSIIIPPDGRIKWELPKPPETKKPRTPAKTKCFIIDKFSRWHDEVSLPLGDLDVTEFNYNYYGDKRPLFIQTKDDMLVPYYPRDAVGESPSLVFIAAKCTAYKNYMRMPSDTLRKIQIGLMAAIVIGILVLIYAFSNR